MSLSAARQVWVMLRDAGPNGVHSLTIRQTGTSGNPSQRLREIAAQGIDVRKRRENVGRRPGIRAWLGEFAPPDATPVQPDGLPNGPDCGGAVTAPVAAAVSVAWVRQLSGEWDEIPTSELGLPVAA